MKPATRRAATEQLPLLDDGLARKMTTPIFAISAGWNDSGPKSTARYAPFTWSPMPGRRGASRRAIEPSAIR